MNRILQFESLESRRLLTSGPIDTHDRGAVIAAYGSQFKPYIDVPVEWTGSVDGCVAGTVSARSTEATLNVLNFLRNLAGVQSVQLDDTFNERAQQAALMMHAQNSLSHSPGPDWACYSAAGAQGAGASNLAFGSTGPTAMVGYVQDPGSGNYFVGHRRWLLNPHVEQMGVGSTSLTNALYVFGQRVTRPAPEWITWPPPGFVPKELVYPRWSISRAGANFDNAAVHMIVHGESVPVAIEPVVNGYAMNTLVWEPRISLDMVSAEEFRVDVRVENVIVNGAATSFQYSVTPMQPGPPIQTIVAAEDDRFVMPAGRPSFYFDVLANDDLRHSDWAPSTTATLAATIVSNPSHGYLLRAVGNPGILFYFPNAGFSGVDSFTYRVADLDAGRVSNLANVRIDVGAGISPANQPPSISSIANLTAIAGTATAPVSFTIFDAETDAANLIVTATSANQTLIPNQHITLSGSGANRTVTVTPPATQRGSDTITLWVSDGQNSIFESFVVTVTAPSVVEDSPWQNPLLQYDVNADRIVTPVDVLLIINYLNSDQPPLLRETDQVSPPYLDVNGDLLVSPIDVLLVINYLNERAIGGEGELSFGYLPTSESSRLLEGFPLAAGLTPWSLSEYRVLCGDLRRQGSAFIASELPSRSQETPASKAGRFPAVALGETRGCGKHVEVDDEPLINLLSHDAWKAGREFRQDVVTEVARSRSS